MSKEWWGVWGVREKVRRVCNVWREGRVWGVCEKSEESVGCAEGRESVGMSEEGWVYVRR